jgi:ankyrin repeat protein/mono/diheme cytochrome c family protein
VSLHPLVGGSVLLVISLAFGVGLAARQQQGATLPPAAPHKVDYDKDVKPILSQHCYACHGPSAQQAGLRLDQRQTALRGGDYGPVILPGDSAASKLIRRLVNGDGGMQMPPTGPLTAEEIGVLRAWIDQGVEFRTEIADEAPPTPTDPTLLALITAIRDRPWSAVEPLLTRQPELLSKADISGATPLHHAAAFGTLETMTALITLGADVRAASRRNATPLHWSVPHEGKVRLLLARGAAVNAKQAEGRTPLYLASMMGDGHNIVRALLDHGADPNLAATNGQTPLMVAAQRGDSDMLRLLLDAKAAVNARNGAGETALMFAAAEGNPKAVALLLQRGADARLRSKRNETALGNAGTSGVEETVRLLLAAGAEVNVQNIRGFSPLMLAASSDAIPSKAVKLLLAHGADTAFTGDYDETARDLAAKRGDTEVSRALGAKVAAPVSPAVTHRVTITNSTLSGAVTRALTMLATQSATFIRTGGCNSCHSQDLPSALNGFARSRGLRVPAEIPQLPAAMTTSPERVLDFNVIGVGSIAWELFDEGMNNVPRNAFSDAMVRYIRATQTPAGHWSANESRRPPMNAGEYQTAALAIYALQQYAPAGDKAGTANAVRRAAAWLESAAPSSSQDIAFQALGLKWAGSSKAAAKARALLALQRDDGGWSQLRTLSSDAYATGQALFALQAAGGLTLADQPIRQGIEYLLRTQANDGSWHVKTRAIWFQPYFESGFPYGQDQFISAAGTAWASMALTAAVQVGSTTTARLRR